VEGSARNIDTASKLARNNQQCRVLVCGLHSKMVQQHVTDTYPGVLIPPQFLVLSPPWLSCLL